MKIIAGSSNLTLATQLSQILHAELINVDITEFTNGEKNIRVRGKIKGETVILLQSLSKPVNDHILELILLADAVERLGASHVIAVIPWLAYSLQDKVFRDGEPISAKVVADLISNSFIHQVYLLDLHNPSIPGFFSVPTFHLSCLDTFTQYVQKHFDLSKSLVVSPDFGGLKKAKHFAEKLSLPLANIDKHRDLQTGAVSVNSLQGENVEGKCALLFDDCIVSGGTAIVVAQLLKQQGASQVHFFATHGLFVGDNTLEKLTTSPLDSIIISDSISHQNLPNKIKVISSASIFAEGMQ